MDRRERGIVPMQFGELVQTLGNKELLAAIDELLERKRASGELDLGPKIGPLHDFIEAELEARQDAAYHFAESKADGEGLNDFFRQTLKAVWKPL